jgi:hypothetical protein
MLPSTISFQWLHAPFQINPMNAYPKSSLVRCDFRQQPALPGCVSPKGWLRALLTASAMACIIMFALAANTTTALAAATGVPGAPNLSPNNYNGNNSVAIIMNMWWGNNGTSWQLFQNGTLVYSANLTDNSPNAQTATSATISNLPLGTYSFTAKLTNSFGTTTSSALSYTVTQGGGTTNPTPPATPTGLTATVNSSSQITVTWNASTGATSYDLQVDGTVHSGVTSPYVSSGLAVSSTHTYLVRADNSAGDSAYSAQVSATTQSGTVTSPPATPTGLAATAGSSSQITVTWNASANATSYDLLVDGATVSGVSSPYTQSGLAASSTHTYEVRADNSKGDSAYSAQVSATTQPTSSTGLTLGQMANPNGRYLTGYYPSWSDNWFSSVNSGTGAPLTPNQLYQASDFAQVPGQYTHVCAAFAQPTFSWSGIAANSWSGTGLDFTAMPQDIKKVVAILHTLNRKVILSVGGATYTNWGSLAAEAGAPGPITAALKQFMIDMDFDGLDVDFEVSGADPATVTQYCRSIQTMRQACDAAGSGHLLMVAAWSTGADYTASTPKDANYPGTLSFWGGNAGRERLAFPTVVTSGSHAGQTIGSLFNVVNVMSYDAGYQNYDAVTAFMEYRLLESSNISVGIGLEIPTEAWGGATLVLHNSDAGATGTVVLQNQYNVVLNQPYSIQRLVGSVQSNTRNANPHDGAMIWDILKTTSPTNANAVSVANYIGNLFGWTATSP